MKKILIYFLFCIVFSINAQAQSKEYTGENITFENDNGYRTNGWVPGKYAIKQNGSAYGYYESESVKTVNVSAFDNKKYDKNKANKQSNKTEAFGGKLYSNSGKEIGKFRMTGAQGEFTFYDPYKVVYIKGRSGKKMAERLIDEGYLKP